MIEKVVDPSLEISDVDEPPFERNLDSELMFFIALRGQRNKRIFTHLTVNVIQEGAGDGLNRRGLKEVAVEAAQNPMQAGNLDGCADAWIGRGLGKSAMVIGDAHAAKECNVPVH